MRGGLVTRTDERIIRAFVRHRYMTAEDVAYLFFSSGSQTHVRQVLSALSGGDGKSGNVLYRVPLPDAKRGEPRRVYTLGRVGLEYAQEALGLTVPWHFKPEKAQVAGFHHLHHSLIQTKVLIAAEKFSEAQTICIS
jgi:hypothetical protein